MFYLRFRAITAAAAYFTFCFTSNMLQLLFISMGNIVMELFIESNCNHNSTNKHYYDNHF